MVVTVCTWEKQLETEQALNQDKRMVLMDKVYWRCYASVEEQEAYENECDGTNDKPCTCSPGDCPGCKDDRKDCE